MPGTVTKRRRHCEECGRTTVHDEISEVTLECMACGNRVRLVTDGGVAVFEDGQADGCVMDAFGECDNDPEYEWLVARENGSIKHRFPICADCAIQSFSYEIVVKMEDDDDD